MGLCVRSCLLLSLSISLAALAAGLTGCATPPTDPEALKDFRQTNDPLEPTNRVFYKVNDQIDAVILRPAAKAYRWALPQRVRNSVHNALANMSSPVLLANDMLQGKSRRAGDTAARFMINTTVGVGGLFDVAKGWGYQSHDSDFGVTLALWGVNEGPFLYLPVLGPTDPRDAAGFGVGILMDPFTWVGQGAAVTALNWSRYATNAVDTRERLLDSIDSIKKTALDPYATFRSLYRQHRHSEIEETRNDNRATVPVWFAQQAAENPPAR
jgi:phospholipid-binding lipoprotein MlaA